MREALLHCIGFKSRNMPINHPEFSEGLPPWSGDAVADEIIAGFNAAETAGWEADPVARFRAELVGALNRSREENGGNGESGSDLWDDQGELQAA